MHTNWEHLYKVNYEKKDKLSPTNMLYTPYVSPEGDKLLMSFDETNDYQKYNNKQPKDLVTFFFHKELENIKQFQNYVWCPKLLDYDIDKQTILIEFNNETLNKIVTDETRNLDIEYPAWEFRIEQILTNLCDMGYYKMSLYPHCFFVGSDGFLKTLDYYAVLKRGETIDREFVKSLVGNGSKDRFDFATNNEIVDFDKFFEYTMKEQLKSTWGENNIFPDMYERIRHV